MIASKSAAFASVISIQKNLKEMEGKIALHFIAIVKVAVRENENTLSANVEHAASGHLLRQDVKDVIYQHRILNGKHSEKEEENKYLRCQGEAA